MKNILAFFSQLLFRKDSFYYHAEAVQFAKEAENARVRYLVAYKKAG